MTTTTAIGPAEIRRHFPSLGAGTVFLENAGGSQVPACVADAIRDYMLRCYAQLDAEYPESIEATQTVHEAHQFIERFMNVQGVGRAILGPSTSVLCRMLADAYLPRIAAGDEIVVDEAGHEANVGPWLRLADLAGATVRWWRVDPATGAHSLDALSEVLSPRTKLVAMCHVSNLLGAINDVPGATRLAHEAGARIVVDGVAYAPHRAIDVAGWGVDWYVYSTYKVYGPHMAALAGRTDATDELTGPNHFFIPRDEVPYKFELGGASHEGCAGLLALRQYLATLAGSGTGDERSTIERAYDVMTACELPVQARLIEFLRGTPGVRLVGPAASGASRVGTISFVHEQLSTPEIVAAALRRNIGIRYGHMYAYRLCEAMGIEPETGVVRVSAVHYNTVEEIDRLIEAWDGVL
jgi:cysteine desulfurase family protein (TIGR01976 family)